MSRVVAVIFDPHPIAVLRPEHAPPTLTDIEQTLLPIDPIRRGDVIVFKYPEQPDRDFIKRVVGMPGEVRKQPGWLLAASEDRTSRPGASSSPQALSRNAARWLASRSRGE